MGDKADAAKVSEIKDKIADLKEAVKSDDVDKIKAASEALTKPLYDLTSEMYKNADADFAAGTAGRRQRSVRCRRQPEAG